MNFKGVAVAEVYENLCEIEVRYAETDKMGIVYHANYLVYMEVARTRFLESIGFPYSIIEGDGYLSPVTNVNINYGIPCTYGDVVQVFTRVTKLTPVRTEYSYRFFVKGDDTAGKPRLTASSTHCIVDGETFKPMNQKKLYPKLFAAYQQVLASE